MKWFVIFCLFLLSACTDYVAQIEDKIEERERTSTGYVNDTRDGQIYKTVKIGNQTWMAQNLNYKTENSYCYNDDPANCSKYGRLYTWAAATSACPSGWHLPSEAELETLIDAVGGQTTAGTKLKSTSGWYDGGNGADAFAFSVLPAGNRDVYGKYTYEGKNAYFWSSSEDYTHNLYFMLLGYDYDVAALRYINKNIGFSVRCLKDEMSDQMEKSLSSWSGMLMTDSRDGQIYRIVTIGYQTWMAQNLNYKTENSYCYNDTVSYCAKYGRLYTWAAAISACPSGWRLPSLEEWDALIAAVGGESAAGKVLKSTSGWNEYNGKKGDGTDAFLFSGLPVGDRDNYGVYNSEGDLTSFWSSTERNDDRAYYMNLYYINDAAGLNYYPKDYAFSVRCIIGFK